MSRTFFKFFLEPQAGLGFSRNKNILNLQERTEANYVSKKLGEIFNQKRYVRLIGVNSASPSLNNWFSFNCFLRGNTGSFSRKLYSVEDLGKVTSDFYLYLFRMIKCLKPSKFLTPFSGHFRHLLL